MRRRGIARGCGRGRSAAAGGRGRCVDARGRFVDTYRSAKVQARLQRAQALMEAYRVSHWPMIAIDGRFLTSPGMVAEAGNISGKEALQGTLRVMDLLVARATADRK